METPKGIQIPLYLWMAANNARTLARGLGIVPNTTGDGEKLSAPEGVPRPSPTLVLTGPYHAWLRSSKGIRYIHGSMADSECKGCTLNNNQNAICIADRFVNVTLWHFSEGAYHSVHEPLAFLKQNRACSFCESHHDEHLVFLKKKKKRNEHHVRANPITNLNVWSNKGTCLAPYIF